jgi:DNA invertase Pin-like site-specific DNA recombinase
MPVASSTERSNGAAADGLAAATKEELLDALSRHGSVGELVDEVLARLGAENGKPRRRSALEKWKAGEPVRIGGYGRTSRLGNRNVDEIQALKQQKGALRRRIDHEGHILVYFDDRDLSVSGAKRSGARSIKRPIKDIETDYIDCVGGDDIHRVTRGDDLERAVLISKIYDAGGAIYTADKGVLDLTDPSVEMTIGIEMVIGRWYQRVARKRAIRNVEDAAFERGVASIPTPYGYAKQKGKPFVPDTEPREAT